MNHWIDRIIALYRPLYQRGLLMDGQCHQPATPQTPRMPGRKIRRNALVYRSAHRRRLLVAMYLKRIHS